MTRVSIACLWEAPRRVVSWELATNNAGKASSSLLHALSLQASAQSAHPQQCWSKHADAIPTSEPGTDRRRTGWTNRDPRRRTRDQLHPPMDIGVDRARTLSAAGRARPPWICASMAQIHNPSISRLPLAKIGSRRIDEQTKGIEGAETIRSGSLNRHPRTWQQHPLLRRTADNSFVSPPAGGIRCYPPATLGWRRPSLSSAPG